MQILKYIPQKALLSLTTEDLANEHINQHLYLPYLHISVTKPKVLPQNGSSFFKV